jgi:carbon-monoxide dehydrogenase large subunit
VHASGQGHRTVYRRLVADYLSIPAEIIRVAHGDSDDEVPSAAAVASRSTMSVGGTVAGALDAVIEKGKRLAVHVLEAAKEAIELVRAREYGIVVGCRTCQDATTWFRSLLQGRGFR